MLIRSYSSPAQSQSVRCWHKHCCTQALSPINLKASKYVSKYAVPTKDTAGLHQYFGLNNPIVCSRRPSLPQESRLPSLGAEKQVNVSFPGDQEIAKRFVWHKPIILFSFSSRDRQGRQLRNEFFSPRQSKWKLQNPRRYIGRKKKKKNVDSES